MGEYVDKVELDSCDVRLDDVMENLAEYHEYALLNWVESNPEKCLRRLMATDNFDESIEKIIRERA